jgi:hypothetical protein
MSSGAESGRRTVAEVFLRHRGRDTIKWEHYLEAYERHFREFVNRKPVVLEIGVMQGGSLQVWKEYFGPGARIIGIDVNPAAPRYAEPGIEIRVGSQGDRAFLEDLARQCGGFDIVIDDGSHRMEDQKTALETLWPHLRIPGVYLCEDVHTSYFTRFGGGFRRPDTFLQRARDLIDALNARWTGRLDRQEVERWTASLHGIHFYPAMVFFEKRPHASVHTVRINAGAIERGPAREPLYGQSTDPTG